VLIGVALVVLALAIIVPIYLMNQPFILGKLHSYEKSYEALQKSAHAGLRCNDCHTQSTNPLVSGAGKVGDFYRSRFVAKAPLWVKMNKPPRSACLACHQEDWAFEGKRTLRVPHPAHLRVSDERRDCVKCHKWTGHEEEYSENHKTMPFSGVCSAFGCHVGWKAAGTCITCHHSLQKSVGQWQKAHPEVVLTSGGGQCMESCHKAKQCQDCHLFEKPLASTTATALAEQKQIEAAHVRSDFMRVHGIMALPDQTKCLTCHISEGECQNCHSRRPATHGSTDLWLSAHKNPAKDKRRCVTCHEKAWCDECHDQFKEMR
jgi:cytochrome c-type protein NapC